MYHTQIFFFIYKALFIMNNEVECDFLSLTVLFLKVWQSGKEGVARAQSIYIYIHLCIWS